jgi:membrane protein DedA with SNARE-associated domain
MEAQQLSGLVGWIVGVIDAFGAPGVAALVAIENVFPPVPSEIVLPFAGFVIGQDGGSVWVMVLAATVGAVIGAAVLYELGRAWGLDRTRRTLARLPLVQAEEVDRAIDWFHRHGQGSVLLGRCVPLIRSLVSLPAGADGMPRLRFLVLTTVGSLVWNAIWVWAGYLLGSRWRQAAQYSDIINYVLIAVVVVVVARFVWQRRDRWGAS